MRYYATHYYYYCLSIWMLIDMQFVLAESSADNFRVVDAASVDPRSFRACNFAIWRHAVLSFSSIDLASAITARSAAPAAVTSTATSAAMAAPPTRTAVLGESARQHW